MQNFPSQKQKKTAGPLMEKNIFSNTIRSFRLERGMTLQQLAQEAGVSPSYLSTIERGLKQPSIPILKQISAALNVSPSVLVRTKDDLLTGSKMKFFREGRGLSVEELAEICEIPASTIERIEAGKVQPGYEQLEQIAEALNLAVTFFVEKSFYKNSIGCRLKKFRESQGITSTFLAEKAGVSVGLISQIENGYTIPTLDTLERLAEALGTTINYFLLEHENVENLLASLGSDLIEVLNDHKVQAVLRSIRDFDANELKYILNYLFFFKKNRGILS